MTSNSNTLILIVLAFKGHCNMKVTVNDIARAGGVSQSEVLINHSQIKEAIFKIIDELNFKPDSVTRIMVKNYGD
ncbi:hypothetical protein ABWK29_28520 [Priestia megaterium]|uniref:hypothetical protein n=1 Tax=Priestia megaterium TaxID=1404 RepID=UPI003398F93A